MASPLKMFATVFYAKRKVKLLGLCLLLFSAPTFAQSPSDFAPFLARKAISWLPDYLREMATLTDPRDPLSLQIHELLETCARFEHVADRMALIEFRAGTDPIFLATKNPRARMAVTGTAIDSKVVFNLDLWHKTDLDFADAMALWVHELAHKNLGAQKNFDLVAAQIARFARAHMHINSKGWMRLDPAPFAYPYPRPEFGLRVGREWLDLGQSLDEQLNALVSPRASFRELGRNLANVQVLEEDEARVLLRLEFRITREPKNFDHYLGSDLGSNFYRTALVEFKTREKNLRVIEYVDIAPPRELIRDAEAELKRTWIEGNELNGELLLHFTNEEHFHASGYPDAQVILLGLSNGRPIELAAKVRYVVDAAVGEMPAEAYGQKRTKRARLSADLSELAPGNLRLLALVDRFFTYGAFATGQDDRKRIPLKEAVSIDLPTSDLPACVKDLGG